MDSRSVAFLEVMAAIGIVGVIAFLIFLVSRHALRTTPGGQGAGYQPQWYEFLLATAAVGIIAVLFLWQFPPWTEVDWSADTRGLTFFVIMLIIGGAGLIIFLLTMFWRVARNRQDPASAASPIGLMATDTVVPEPVSERVASHESPSAVRLLGLFGLGIAYLILNWSYVPHEQQYSMMLYLIYPAGLIVALVMLFDKASRAWNIKLPDETLREWLFCDAIVFLYLIGYLNLLNSGAGDAYAAMFWDFLNVLAFLLVLWIIDRKVTRLRFLIGHLYLLALPILLLIWQTVQEVELAPEISWWGTIWPFFFLALIFFVLEIIVLIANRDNDSQGAGTAKDIIFLILYVILLIAARPEAVA